MAAAIVLLILVVNLGAVWSRSLPLGGGVRNGPLLEQSSVGWISVHNHPSPRHSQVSYLAHFGVGLCVQHRRTVQRLGPVLGGAILGWHIHVCLFLVEIIFTLYTLYVIFQLKHILIH